MHRLCSLISNIFLWFMNIALFFVGAALIAALSHTLFILVQIAWNSFFSPSAYAVLIEELITFFLYFEFIALIVKYFKNNFHFPLHYFLYIGITAIVRLLIVSHDEAVNMLIWSVSIFVLVVSLLLVDRFIKHD